MICYTLKCRHQHRFESWFPSSDAFERQQMSGLVVCPACGSAEVDKSLMTPAVTRTGRQAGAQVPRADTPAQPDPDGSTQASREKAIAELRRVVEQGSDYVGLRFAAEARAIHAGDAPARSIYGEARPDEARALLADGVPVAPLPFIPTRRTH